MDNESVFVYNIPIKFSKRGGKENEHNERTCKTYSKRRSC